MNNRAKYWNYLYLLVTVFFVALIISFPQIPIKFNLWKWNVDTTFESPDINLNILGTEVQKDLDFRWGMEFGGGYSLILSTDLENVEENSKEQVVKETIYILKDRANQMGLSDYQIYFEQEEGVYKIYMDLGNYEDFQTAFMILQKGELSFQKLSEENKNTEDTEILYDPESYVDTSITNDDFDKAVLTENLESGEPAIQLVFTEEGLEKFGTEAQANIGYPIAIMVDGSIISAPTISEDFLLGGVSHPVVSGGFDADYAELLVKFINSEDLPISVELESTDVVEAFWNVDVINKALVALGIGFILACIYLVWVYKQLGFVFFFSAIFNFILSVSLTKFGFPTILSWLFSGEMPETFFNPLVITTVTLLGLLLSNLFFFKSIVNLLELLKDQKGNVNEDFVDSNFMKSRNQVKYVWFVILIISIVLGWFGLGKISELGNTLGLFSLVSIFTFCTFTRVLVHLFNKSK